MIQGENDNDARELLAWVKAFEERSGGKVAVFVFQSDHAMTITQLSTQQLIACMAIWVAHQLADIANILASNDNLDS